MYQVNHLRGLSLYLKELVSFAGINERLSKHEKKQACEFITGFRNKILTMLSTFLSKKLKMSPDIVPFSFISILQVLTLKG